MKLFFVFFLICSFCAGQKINISIDSIGIKGVYIKAQICSEKKVKYFTNSSLLYCVESGFYYRIKKEGEIIPCGIINNDLMYKRKYKSLKPGNCNCEVFIVPYIQMSTNDIKNKQNISIQLLYSDITAKKDYIYDMKSDFIDLK